MRRIAWYTRIPLCVTAAVLWPGKVLSPTSHRPPMPAARGILLTPAPPARGVGVRRDGDRALVVRRAATIIGRVGRDEHAVGLTQWAVVAGDHLVVLGHAGQDGRLIYAQIQRASPPAARRAR